MLSCIKSYPCNHCKKSCPSARRAQIGTAFDRIVPQERALLSKHIGYRGKCVHRSRGMAHCSQFSAILVKNPRVSRTGGMTFCNTPERHDFMQDYMFFTKNHPPNRVAARCLFASQVNWRIMQPTQRNQVALCLPFSKMDRTISFSSVQMSASRRISTSNVIGKSRNSG